MWKLPESRDPAATVVKARDERPAYLRVDLQRHPWRELHSVLALAPSRVEGGALALQHLRGSRPQDTVSIWTGGLAADKAKIIDAAEWSFTLPLTLLGSRALHRYETGVELAERASWQLASAVARYFEDVGIGEFKRKDNGSYSRRDSRSREQRDKTTARAKAHFWSELDARYDVLMAAAGDERQSLGETWYHAVVQAMNGAYGAACPRSTARRIRAFVKGQRVLWLASPEDEGDARRAEDPKPTSTGPTG